MYVYRDISMHEYYLCRENIPQMNKSVNSA